MTRKSRGDLDEVEASLNPLWHVRDMGDPTSPPCALDEDFERAPGSEEDPDCPICMVWLAGITRSRERESRKLRR